MLALEAEPALADIATNLIESNGLRTSVQVLQTLSTKLEDLLDFSADSWDLVPRKIVNFECV